MVVYTCNNQVIKIGVANIHNMWYSKGVANDKG